MKPYIFLNLLIISSAVVIYFGTDLYYWLQSNRYSRWLFTRKPFSCVLCTSFWVTLIWLYSQYGFSGALMLAFPTSLFSELLFRALDR